MRRTFTGWHMTGILVSFFGVVIGVNMVMAHAAIGTFGGTVVDNSYVASQRFNGWLDQAEAQKALGWEVASMRAPNRHLAVRAMAAGTPLQGAEISAVIRHPLGRAPEQSLDFRRDGTSWISTTPLPQGRWLVHLRGRRGADRYQVVEDLQ